MTHEDPESHGAAGAGAAGADAPKRTVAKFIWWNSVVEYRWLLFVVFVVFYYLGVYDSCLIPIPASLEGLVARSKPVLLGIDLVVVVVAAVAVYPAVTADYVARLQSGVKALRDNPAPQSPLCLKDVLEHARWCNVKLYAVMTVVLGVAAATLPRTWVPADHEPVALAITVLLFVALFDSLLDLEAEWTVTMLSATEGKQGQRSLGFVIWKTNQFRTEQGHLLEATATLDTLKASQATATAQNIIMFAVAIIVGTLARIAWQLGSLLCGLR